MWSFCLQQGIFLVLVVTVWGDLFYLTRGPEGARRRLCLERNNVDIVCSDDCEPRNDWDFSTDCTCYVGRGEEIICERMYARANLCSCQIFRFGRLFPVPLSTPCRLSEGCSCEMANLGIERCDPEMESMSPEMERMSPDLSMSGGMLPDVSRDEDNDTTTTEEATTTTEPTTTDQSDGTSSSTTTEEPPTSSTEVTSTTDARSP